MIRLKSSSAVLTACLFLTACQMTSAPIRDETAAPAAVPSAEPAAASFSFSTENFVLEADPGQVFTLEANDQRWILDYNGNPIESWTQVKPVLDLVSGKTTAYRLIRAVLPDEQPAARFRAALTLTTLVDGEGNRLQDEANVSYSQESFLNYVVRYQEPENSFWEVNGTDPRGALIDRQTGQIVLDGVVSLRRLSSGQVLCLDKNRRQIGVIDADGTLMKTKPSSFYFSEGGPGWSLWCSAEVCELRNDQNEEIWTGKGYPMESANGRLWLRESDYGSQETLRNPEGQTTWMAETHFLYADEELAVTCDWQSSYRTGDALIDLTGAVRSEGYRSVAADPRGGQDAQFFLMTREDALDKLDRQGQVVQTLSVPGIQTVERMEDGLFKFTVYDDRGTTEGLIDDALQILIPAGQYSTIQFRQTWLNQEMRTYPYFICWKYANYVQRADIYNLKLEKIAENVTEIGDVSADRLFTLQGFEGVLIDSDGLCLKRFSMFTDYKGE